MRCRGEHQINPGAWGRWHTIELGPGDVAVFDPMSPHRVTEVEAGERIVIQTRLQDWR